MKHSKRILSLMLALAMILSILVMPASAISMSSELVIDPVYEDAERFVQGYAAVKLNGKWGYINDTGDMVVEAKYDWASESVSGYAVVAKLGPALTLNGITEDVYVIYLIDMNGMEIQLNSPYIDDATGQAIPLYYISVEDIENDNSVYWGYSDGVINAGWWPYTTKGELIMPTNPEVLDVSESGFYMLDNCIDGIIPMCAYYDDHFVYFHMDASGSIVRTFSPYLPSGDELHILTAPNDGLTLAYTLTYDAYDQPHYYYGVLNEDDEWVMKPEYDYIANFLGGLFLSDGVIVAAKDGKYGMFDAKGNSITALEYDNMMPFTRGRTSGSKDGVTYILDSKGSAYPVSDLQGKPLGESTVTAFSDVGIAAVYDHVTGESYCISKNAVDGLIPVVDNSQDLGKDAYFIDRNSDGNIDTIAPPSELIAVYRDGKWGYALLEVEHDNPFDDLKEGKFYVDAVLWAVYENITNGVTATQFKPDQTCTRSQIVTFIWRAMGCPEPESMENPFTDVQENAYYYKAVLWAVEQGITTGKTATTFCPKEPCTRNQAVTFLWRAAGKPAPKSTDHTFADVSSNAYYADAVAWAVEQGITKGVNATTFAPKDECTRGHIVTFLYRNLVGE